MNQNFTARVIGKGVLQAPTPTEKTRMPEQAFTEQDWRRFLASLGENPDRSGLAHHPDCQYLNDASETASGWRSHSLSAPVHGKLRHSHPGEETVTSSMLGELHSNQALRAEFFALAREAYFNFWNEHLKHRPSNSDRTPADPKGAAIPLSEAHLHLKGGIDTPVPRY